MKIKELRENLEMSKIFFKNDKLGIVKNEIFGIHTPHSRKPINDSYSYLFL